MTIIYQYKYTLTGTVKDCSDLMRSFDIDWQTEPMGEDEDSRVNGFPMIAFGLVETKGAVDGLALASEMSSKFPNVNVQVIEMFDAEKLDVYWFQNGQQVLEFHIPSRD